MNRGKPLAWALREEIRRRVAAGETRRQVGKSMSLAHATVVKYAKGMDARYEQVVLKAPARQRGRKAKK